MKKITLKNMQCCLRSRTIPCDINGDFFNWVQICSIWESNPIPPALIIDAPPNEISIGHHRQHNSLKQAFSIDIWYVI